MKYLNKLALFLIYLRSKTFSSHTGIFKDILYTDKVCTHHPHCSKYAKECFQKYDFFTAFKYTMTRITNCKPDNKINYDPSSYRVVYFSSALIGLPFLEKMVEDKRFDVVGVVTMPDAPFGRGQKFKENIIAEKAKEIGIKNIYKPEKIDEDFSKTMEELKPDFFVVLSYGKILPKYFLDIPKLGPINIHGSILPKYRGASPLQSVFLNGEKETGITIMYMDEKMDTGDIIKILKIPLTKQDNTKTLIDKITKYGPDFFVDSLWKFGKKEYIRTKQDESKATYCKKFKKEDGQINFKNSSEEIYRQYQAFYLWPGIYTFWNGKKISFLSIDFENTEVDKKIGEVFLEEDIVKIKCGKGNIIIKEIKLEGKKSMKINDYINGYKDFVGSVLGD